MNDLLESLTREAPLEKLKLCVLELSEIEHTLGAVLYGYELIDGVALPCWGEHVASTLACEAANKLKHLSMVR